MSGSSHDQLSLTIRCLKTASDTHIHGRLDNFAPPLDNILKTIILL
jgi:hypothetical protein